MTCLRVTRRQTVILIPELRRQNAVEQRVVASTPKSGDYRHSNGNKSRSRETSTYVGSHPPSGPGGPGSVSGAMPSAVALAFVPSCHHAWVETKDFVARPCLPGYRLIAVVVASHFLQTPCSTARSVESGIKSQLSSLAHIESSKRNSETTRGTASVVPHIFQPPTDYVEGGAGPSVYALRRSKMDKRLCSEARG